MKSEEINYVVIRASDSDLRELIRSVGVERIRRQVLHVEEFLRAERIEKSERAIAQRGGGK